MAETDCPSCPRGFESQRALKIHFVAVHGYEIKEGGVYPWEEAKEYTSLVCEECGGEYDVPIERKDESRFCSQSCLGKHNGRKFGKKGGNVVRKSTRERVKNRDNRECQRCGIDTSKENVHEEIHHLLPKAAGGPDHEMNLITLCGRCHTNAHWQMKKIAEHHPELLQELREVVCE